MRKRHGFTLVELLVVIAIIGMLMSLLLPAIQAARESGRGITCRNNVRNVAFALNQYEANRGELPDLLTTKRGIGRPLMYEILPQLERNDIYETYSRDSGASLGTFQSAIASAALKIEILSCPSDPQSPGPGTAYVYNVGRGRNSNRFKADGVFGLGGADRSGSLSYVGSHDGTSNTLMLSENMEASAWITTSPTLIGFAWLPPANTSQKRINQDRGGTNDGSWPWARPSCNHPQSVNVVFCDMHVRTLSENIAPSVLAQLMSSWGARASVAYPLLNDADYN